MSIKTGAGSAVSSGANYQARVAAYVISCSICDMFPSAICESKIDTISFEIAEKIDDILITNDDEKYYIQAKANINFSSSITSEFASVFKQFTLQERIKSKYKKEAFILATTPRASKKIVYDTRNALDAYRNSPVDAFERDQTPTIKNIISDLKILISEIMDASFQKIFSEDIDIIIRKSFVAVIPVEEGDHFENSIMLLLQMNKFIPHATFWGKIVSDCLNHATHHRTISIDSVKKDYAKYRIDLFNENQSKADSFWKIQFGDMAFPTGKEVFLCDIPKDDEASLFGYTIFELPRFTEDGKEQIRFTEDKVYLPESDPIPLICRCATVRGLQRIIKNYLGEVDSSTINIVDFELDIDFEENSYAKIHREKLKAIAATHDKFMNCIHCGLPVTEFVTNIIEVNDDTDVAIGIAHKGCLRPCDRIMGTATCPFFEDFPELVNFDLNAWIKASLDGQQGIPSSSLVQQNAIIGWGGSQSNRKLEMYMVVFQLEDGSEEVIHRRNDVERLSKKEALKFIEWVNTQIGSPEYQNDPFCYSEQSKIFSNKSLLLKQVGGKERLIPVQKAYATKYNVIRAKKYKRTGLWYAPLFYLRSIETGQVFPTEHDMAFLLTNPLTLKLFLDNWDEVGLAVPSYEIISLLDDSEFDEFMRWASSQHLTLLIDPIFSSDHTLVSGWPVDNIDNIVPNKPWE